MSKETHPQIEEQKYSSPAEEYIFLVQIIIFFASDNHTRTSLFRLVPILCR